MNICVVLKKLTKEPHHLVDLMHAIQFSKNKKVCQQIPQADS